MAKRKVQSTMDELTPKQRVFVTEYIADGNGTRAATEAGYAHPQIAASKLLARDIIKTALAEEMKPILVPKRLTAKRLARQLSNYVFRSIKDFCDDDGYLITKVKDLPDEVAQCVESWEVEVLEEWDPDTRQRVEVGKRVKVKLVSKSKMQEIAMKYLKMLGPEVQQQTNLNINIGDVLWGEAQAPVVDSLSDKLKVLGVSPNGQE